LRHAPGRGRRRELVRLRRGNLGRGPHHPIRFGGAEDPHRRRGQGVRSHRMGREERRQEDGRLHPVRRGFGPDGGPGRRFSGGGHQDGRITNQGVANHEVTLMTDSGETVFPIERIVKAKLVIEF